MGTLCSWLLTKIVYSLKPFLNNSVQKEKKMHFSSYRAHFTAKYNIYKPPISMMRHIENSRRGRVSHLQFKMAKGRHRHHRYSAEEIMNAVMASSDSEQFSTDSDESDLRKWKVLRKPSRLLPRRPPIAEKEKPTEIAVSPITAPNSQKVYVELQTVCTYGFFRIW